MDKMPWDDLFDFSKYKTSRMRVTYEKLDLCTPDCPFFRELQCMKLEPIKKYKKRLGKASDERLIKMWNAASQVRSQTTYYEAACEEMNKRGLTYETDEEVEEDDSGRSGSSDETSDSS